MDLHWREGKPTEARIRSTGGRTTTVAHAGSTRTVTLKPGTAVTLRGFGR
ncbi:Alpha-L-fucosidase 2 OS=Streptomyces griseorubiginosus OX=67304 GN=AQJ54_29125 PE=4 SV=1 [Streptomyces griseorubiginosus]